MTTDIFPLAMLCLSVAAIGNLFSGREVGAHPSRLASNRTLLFFTGAGILVGFGFVIIPLSSAFRLILTPLKLPWLTIVGLDSVLTKTIVLVALPAFVLYGERRPLSSIGIRKADRAVLSRITAGGHSQRGNGTRIPQPLPRFNLRLARPRHGVLERFSEDRYTDEASHDLLLSMDKQTAYGF